MKLSKFRYELPKESQVRLEVFNALGQKVAILLDEPKKAGYHSANWDASKMASGLYFYRIKTRNFVKVKKMLLLR